MASGAAFEDADRREGAIVDVRTSEVLGRFHAPGRAHVVGVGEGLDFVSRRDLDDETIGVPGVVPVLSARDAAAPDDSVRRASLLAVEVDGLHALLGSDLVRPDFVILHGALSQVADPEDEGAAVVAAIATFARRRSIRLVATEVADQLRFDVLRSLGVTHAAGPHVDRRLALDPSPSLGRSPQERARAFRLDLEAAVTLSEVAAVTCAHVVEMGLLPSIYVESHGLMRCIAQRGYWQIMDGIPVDRGVIGRTYRTNKPQFVDAKNDPAFIGAAPGLMVEVTAPLTVGGVVRGVLSVEATRELDPTERHQIERIATEVERAMQRVAFEFADGAVHRLARATAELAALEDEAGVAHAAVRLACRVSLMGSGMLALPNGTGTLTARSYQGPLGPSLRDVAPELLAELASHLDGVSSCISGGDEGGRVQPALESLRRSGATALGAFPLDCGDSRGLLIVADQAPGELEAELREAMELLAGAIGQAFHHVRLVDALRTRAQRDHLTSVGNRSAFDELATEMDRSTRSPDDRTAVLVADLDRFKQVNDRFGHHAGDRLLVDTVDSMAAALRPGDQLFRIGGDEFAIVVPGVDRERAVALADRICDRVRPHLEPAGASLSIGIALLGPEETVYGCLRRADRVLYEVKRSGEGGVRLAEQA